MTRRAGSEGGESTKMGNSGEGLREPSPGFLRSVEEMRDRMFPNFCGKIPISFRGLPDLVKLVWRLTSIYDDSPELCTNENMIIFMRNVLQIADWKLLISQRQLDPDDEEMYIIRLKLPYPIAIYISAIGKFNVDGGEVVPELVQHNIKVASGAINYSLTDLITLMKEFKDFRSVNDEIVAVARSISDLPGVHWVEECEKIKLSASTLSSWTVTNNDDWNTFQSILTRMEHSSRCFFRTVDFESLQGSPIQAVRFPEPYNRAGEISYYVNISIPNFLEKLAPALMLGYEHGGEVSFSRFCGARGCLKLGRAIVGPTEDFMFWVDYAKSFSSYENVSSDQLDLIHTASHPYSTIPIIRIPISFRALPKMVRAVWDYTDSMSFHGRKKDPRDFQVFLRCIMHIAEMKLAFAEADTVMKVGLRRSYMCRYCKLPYPIATFINNIGRFTVQNQTVIPELIKHEMESASGAINFSLSGIIKLIGACSDFLSVDAPIVKIAKSALNDLNAEVGETLVEWEPHPNDPGLIRISESSVAGWTLPSRDDESTFQDILAKMAFVIRERAFMCSVDVTAGLGSAVQAVRFPEPFVPYGPMVSYRNVPVTAYEENLAPALMLGYEHGGKVFSRFCSSSYLQSAFCGHGCFFTSFTNIMNEVSR